MKKKFTLVRTIRTQLKEIVSDSYPKPKTETGKTILPGKVPGKLPQSSKKLTPAFERLREFFILAVAL